MAIKNLAPLARVKPESAGEVSEDSRDYRRVSDRRSNLHQWAVKQSAN